MYTESIQMGSLMVAVIALCWTAYGVYLNRKIKQAEFWLKLRDDFAKYDDVHLRLRPGASWSSGHLAVQRVLLEACGVKS